jgi:tetratricopeptide (TPR) repeat protein
MLVALTLALAAGQAAGQSLRAPEVVAGLYDRILDADFDAVAADLRACAGLAREACDVLEATRIWWQLQRDPEATTLDPAFQQAVGRAIASSDAWTRREPARAEAWFYLGGAYGARVQWHVLRRAYLSAARDGKRVKDALERCLRLDPALEDANFGIGLYQYYADIAPTAAKILRVLLMLPGGDRKGGLARMLRARDRGQVLRGEADYQLHIIDLWYEQQFPRARGLLERLAQRYPHNPLFPQLIAEVDDVYFHDRTASLEGWQTLLGRARRGEVREAAIAQARARLGAAQQLDALQESDAAIDIVRPLTERDPSAPLGAPARAWLQLGVSLDRVGRASESRAALERALASAPPGDPHGVRARARATLRAPTPPQTARAYALSLEGWRAFEGGELAAAARALDASLAAREDPVARYRRGRVLRARGQAAAALADYERVLAARADALPTFYAAACVEAGAILEAAGDRARALELYARASGVFGAAASTRERGAREAARLRGEGPARR